MTTIALIAQRAIGPFDDRLALWAGKNFLRIKSPGRCPGLGELKPLRGKDYDNQLCKSPLLMSSTVTNISPHGLWLLVDGKEYLLPFDKFPWFKKSSLQDLFEVELLHGFHLHWPKLDIDLELASLENPEQYPLVYSIGPANI